MRSSSAAPRDAARRAIAPLKEKGPGVSAGASIFFSAGPKLD
jgi:hypothetical protein